MKSKNKIIYWIFTLLFALPLGLSGIAFLLHLQPNVDGMQRLGYPLYILDFIGLAKVLGALVILIGKPPTLKEWAYAGFTFDLLGAAYSHYRAGEGPKFLAPLAMLAIMFISYALWKSRRARR